MSEPGADLYALPLEEFIAARDRLAKELRGRRDGAAEEVRRLPKPTVAAWAVNQLVHHCPKLFRAALEAGDRLRAAQAQAIDGDARDQLRAATSAEREAISQLAEEARDRLQTAGAAIGEATLRAVTETLHAAAVDPDARRAVEEGQLVRPLRARAFPSFPTRPGDGRRRPDRRRAEAAKRRQEEQTRARTLAAAKARLERAEARVGEAESRLRRARDEADQAREAVADAARSGS